MTNVAHHPTNGIGRASLFGKLNPTALESIRTATAFCRQRTNPNVELAHWLHVLQQNLANDLAAIARHFGVDESRLAADTVEALNKLPRGSSDIEFSPSVEDAVERAWVHASLQFGVARIRTGHLLFGMLRSPSLQGRLFGVSREWRKVHAEALVDNFAAIVAKSAEEEEAAEVAAVEAGPGVLGGDSALARYAIDLTARARNGEIDRIVGRDAEIRQIIDTLLRRRQNNPILTGEAGVGKTAVVEGFARRVADGDVPPALRDASVHALDIGLLQAGAGVRGEFEKRLRAVIDEVEASPRPLILFIDEAHTLIGAGGQAGSGDAANLLKPALARGRLRTIAATTWTEYRQYFEKDPALTRRFQTVNVSEPDDADAIAMLRSVAPLMARHHQVAVLDEAVEAAVRLSQRYVPARQLPDKAVSLLDTACARVAVSQHATPPAVEAARRKAERLELEIEIAGREAAARYAGEGRAARLADPLAQAQADLATTTAKWEAEKVAHAHVAAARAALAEERVADPAELDAALGARAAAQGDAPMVFGEVDANAVASVVGDWTGIPVGRMIKDEIAGVLGIAERLKRRVVGQDHALEAIARRVQTSRAKLDNPNKPIGVFMLCGPSGVGKTETAHALAELLYSGDASLTVINMSEFQEAHTVSTLKGAPAGYVGYGQGGVLTEAVRRRPYSVVLLDEVEKAHPDVHEMFFQVFDKGYMEDAEGRFIDFRNTIILLTSNVGSDLVTKLSEDPELAPEHEALGQALRPELLKVFPPALLGRLIVLPYYPLSTTMLGDIVRLQLDRIVRRLAENHGIAFTYDHSVVDLIVARCTEVASGGRMIDAILTNTMLPELSVELLERQMNGVPVERIHVGVAEAAFTYEYSGGSSVRQ
ncbi:type VI secretion system ATPase TssH [Caulobacter flavus]|uniref:Type VI secretion system ATPase TssH n=1 Tax=Caulobacter flavus TaxID=1679497 RepID=A0A2N5CZG9_9CAUL|nr:type VI secretion system ATPase TssH [Caulobacter flavus]AYV45145.1 type VI secretion system ATPase TssH [Caulobacter flavus]PLR19175.1 type VI secretion system ATPase TssH [Caulobacter flavus]